MPKKVLFIAGDKSGDTYGGLVSQELKKMHPDIEIFSCAGPHLAQHSTQLIDLTRYAVSGIFEVARSLKKILAVFTKTLREIERIKPDVIIPIDFPDFNLRLVKRLNKRYPIIYYVSPQLWAWRKGRIKHIKKYVDTMVVLFPFEVDFYRSHGIEALYFGHPLLETIPQAAVERKKVISFMPGSRKNEVRRHLPIMAAAKDLIQQKLPGYSFRVIRPQNLKMSLYQKYAPQLSLVDHSYQTIQESSFIVTASGTATMELAILGVPFLIIYKVNSFTWLLLKRMVTTPFVGMVNILAGKKVVAELLQSQLTSQAIATETIKTITNRNRQKHITDELALVKKMLTPTGATKAFASHIAHRLGR